MTNHSSGFPSPSMNFMLSQQVLASHELAFFLTEEWPGNMCYYALPSQFYDKFGRGVIYRPENGIDPTVIPKRTIDLLNALTSAAKSRQICSFPTGSYLDDQEVLLLYVWEVLIWALRNGYQLPKILQEKFCLRQLGQRSNQKKVKNKFTGHLIHKLYPLLPVDKVKNHPLMIDFGDKSLDGRRRQIYEDLKDAFRIKSGERGKETPITKPLSPLEEIMRTGPDGKNHYCFQSLGIAISIATKIVLATDLKNILMMTEAKFMWFMWHHDFLFPYLKQTSKVVFEMFTTICLETLMQGYSHYKIKQIPFEEKVNMPIGELMHLNFKYIYEKFTPEERESLGINSSEKEMFGIYNRNFEKK